MSDSLPPPWRPSAATLARLDSELADMREDRTIREALAAGINHRTLLVKMFRQLVSLRQLTNAATERGLMGFPVVDDDITEAEWDELKRLAAEATK